MISSSSLLLSYSAVVCFLVLFNIIVDIIIMIIENVVTVALL